MSRGNQRPRADRRRSARSGPGTAHEHACARARDDRTDGEGQPSRIHRGRAPRVDDGTDEVQHIAWALFNLAVAYTLLVLVGGLELHHVVDVSIAAAGFALGSFGIARSVTRMRLQRESAATPA